MREAIVRIGPDFLFRLSVERNEIAAPQAIDAFKADTGATIDQFLTRKITLHDCLTMLADALTTVKPELQPSEFSALTDIVIANNAKVMSEAERREQNRMASREYYRKSKLY